jgi:AraC-like DNA-binding protein
MRRYFTHTDQVVPVHHPRVLAMTALAQGADRVGLFANTGFSLATLASPEARISYQQYGVLTQNAISLTRNPALGLDVGYNIGLPQMGPLALSLLSSPTLGAALETFLRFAPRLLPCFELEMRTDDTRCCVIIREAIPLEPFRKTSIESFLMGFQQQSRMLYGQSFPLRSLRLDYPAPPYVERYREICTAPITFDQSATEIEFDVDLLNTVIQFADPATAKLAEHLCSQQLPPTASSEGLLAQIRNLLSATRNQPPGIDALAKALQTSPRTLRRALHEMGTSYQQLLTEFRKARALDWIESTQLTLAHISEQLGFSDVRSFRRAFKRWTGRRPSAFRNHRLNVRRYAEREDKKAAPS